MSNKGFRLTSYTMYSISLLKHNTFCSIPILFTKFFAQYSYIFKLNCIRTYCLSAHTETNTVVF